MSFELYKRIIESHERLERMRQPDLVRLIERNRLPILDMAFANALKEMHRRSALYEATRSMLGEREILQQLEATRLTADEFQRHVNRAFLPDLRAIDAMADSMAKHVQLVKTLHMAQASWSQLLARQMSAVQTPWLDPHFPSLSFEGFAVISRLGQMLSKAEALDGPVRAQLDEDLGEPIDVDDEAGPDEKDEAHIAAGMNPAMLTISPGGIGDVLIQTGFVLKTSFAPLPATTDGSDPGHVFHPGHNMLITVVEQNLRATIENLMRKTYGKTWIETRIDPKVSQGWSDRRDTAAKTEERSLGLIQYAHFMELSDIVVHRKHWSEVFCTVFGNKCHFLTSMQRLHSVRNPLAHSRPIGIGQQFHLISEAAYILRPLGVDIFE